MHPAVFSPDKAMIAQSLSSVESQMYFESKFPRDPVIMPEIISFQQFMQRVHMGKTGLPPQRKQSCFLPDL